MNVEAITNEQIEAMIAEILDSSKYRGLSIPHATLLDLFMQELPNHKRSKELKQSVKTKLHRIVAPYLGDPDYNQAAIDLDNAIKDGEQAIDGFCLEMLASHASTRERLPIMEHFYEQIFNQTGIPASILDLACGLNPFALPWMHLPLSSSYYAYDLHQPRVELINHFLKHIQRPELAVCSDILVEPPQVIAEVAFFFKEAHRFEQRQRGSNRLFWLALPVKTLVVSLPAISLSGRHDKIDQHQRLVYDAIRGTDWPVTEISAGSELIFIIKKAV